jgi:hypothetical protein
MGGFLARARPVRRGAYSGGTAQALHLLPLTIQLRSIVQQIVRKLTRIGGCTHPAA